MGAFPHLFQPIELRGHEIANRLFFPAHGTSLGERGRVSERLIAYHEARAAGGVGMIVIEGMSMHPSFDIAAGYLLAGQEESVPGFAALAAAVRRHGCRILGQGSSGPLRGQMNFLGPAGRLHALLGLGGQGSRGMAQHFSASAFRSLQQVGQLGRELIEGDQVQAFPLAGNRIRQLGVGN